jgi:hypothetical protein
MESLILWGTLIVVGCWIYRAGKRTGSRKAYHVGLRRGRFRR